MLCKLHISQKFWANVEIKGQADCWEWKLSKTRKGYGQYRFNGVMMQTHRIAWALTNGDIPQGKLVCHKCDNPGCVNPLHLFLGTHFDNMADMVSKGRQIKGDIHPARMFKGKVVGSKNGRSKITEDDADQIRQLYSMGGIKQKELGEKFGINQRTVSTIVTGKNWNCQVTI